MTGTERGTSDVFSALAEPKRRQMLSILARGERSAGELAQTFPRLTQPAASRHLLVLREARLVEARPQKQMRIYSLRPERLRELDQWLFRYRPLLSGGLDSLEEHLDKRRAASKRGGM